MADPALTRALAAITAEHWLRDRGNDHCDPADYPGMFVDFCTEAMRTAMKRRPRVVDAGMLGGAFVRAAEALGVEQENGPGYGAPCHWTSEEMDAVAEALTARLNQREGE